MELRGLVCGNEREVVDRGDVCTGAGWWHWGPPFALQDCDVGGPYGSHDVCKYRV